MTTLCDVIDNCTECPRYGDDCDGDKKTEHTDLISRADAIDACCRGWNNTAEDCIRNIKALPSAELPKGELISRADAIEAVCDLYRVSSLFSGGSDRREDWYEKAEKLLSKCPSAEAEPTVIRSKTLMPTKDFKEWAKRVREGNPNVIVIPCDAELVSAEAVSIHEDGTLEVKVPNAHKVGRVLVKDADSHIGGGLFYPDREDGE